MDTPKQVASLLDKYAENTVLEINTLYNDHVASQTKFAYASLRESGGSLYVRKLIHWLGCRGYMCEALFSSKGGKDFYHASASHSIQPYVNANVACLLMKDTNLLHASQAVHMLNYMESQAGWEQCFVREYKYKTSPRDSIERTAFLWVGDKRWFSSTIYLSLLLLLIRMAGKVLFEPNDTISSWAKRAYYSDGYGVRSSDKTSIASMFKHHTNTVQLMLEHHEFLTEELDYEAMRRKYPQNKGHESGINMAATAANKLHGSDLENKTVIDRWFYVNHRDAPYIHINDHLVLRLAVVLNEYGNNKPLFPPRNPRKNIF